MNTRLTCLATIVFAVAGALVGETASRQLKPTRDYAGDVIELPFDNAFAFCAAMDAVVIAKAVRATSKQAKVLGRDMAKAYMQMPVMEIIRHDPARPIGDTIPVVFATGTHELRGEKLRFASAGFETPKPQAELLLFLKWDASFQAFYPMSGGAGVFEVVRENTLVPQSRDPLSVSIARGGKTRLTGDLRANQDCAR